MTSPVFIFVGHSGSGKTTLVEKLLPELTTRGLRLATIKHAHHKVELDKEGKDSWRYKKAGAVMSMLVTSNELQIVADAVDRREPGQLAERRECGKPPRCAIEDGLIAIVTDMDEIYPQLPHFDLDDIAGLADFLLEHAAR